MTGPNNLDLQNNQQGEPAGLTDHEKEILALRQANANMVSTMNAMNQKIDGISGVIQAATAPQAPQLTKEDYDNDPVATLNKLVEHQLTPLKQAFAESTRINQLTTIKNQLKAQYPDLAMFEQYYDTMMGNSQFVNLQVAQSAYFMAKGAFISQNGNKIPDGNPGNQNNNQGSPATPPVNNNIPAHLRPQGGSSRPGTQDATPKLRQLTELEHRIAKEQSQSPAAYLYWGGEIDAATAKANGYDPNAK